MKNLDQGKVRCGIFVDFQKATVDQHILPAILEHYGIRAVAKNYFKSYLSVIEGNFSLSRDSILIMLCLNMEFPKALQLDQSFS